MTGSLVLAADYSGAVSALTAPVASALAITASARFNASLSSALCHVSPSSDARSKSSSERETSVRSTVIASESSFASASLCDEGVTSLSPVTSPKWMVGLYRRVKLATSSPGTAEGMLGHLAYEQGMNIERLGEA